MRAEIDTDINELATTGKLDKDFSSTKSYREYRTKLEGKIGSDRIHVNMRFSKGRKLVTIKMKGK